MNTRVAMKKWLKHLVKSCPFGFDFCIDCNEHIAFVSAHRRIHPDHDVVRVNRA